MRLEDSFIENNNYYDVNLDKLRKTIGTTVFIVKSHYVIVYNRTALLKIQITKEIFQYIQDNITLVDIPNKLDQKMYCTQKALQSYLYLSMIDIRSIINRGHRL